MIAKVGIRNKRTHRFYLLAVPVWLVELLLLPLFLLLLPVILLVCLLVSINPFRAIGLFLTTLGALKGTHLEMEDHRHSVLIHVA